MVAHPLDGSWAKMNRASEHLETLQAQIATSTDDREGVAIRQEFDPNANTIKAIVDYVPPLPIPWSLIAADALQNLRSALNYVAYELAVLSLSQSGIGRSPSSSTQFPIIEKPGLLKPTSASVADINPTHFAVIEGLQPYNRAGWSYVSGTGETLYRVADDADFPRWVNRHPLVVLKKFTNWDKHHVLTLLSLGPRVAVFNPGDGIDCDIINSEMGGIGPLEKGTIWRTFNVRPTGPQPKVKMNDHLTPWPAMENGEGVEVAIEGMMNAVVHIIREFEKAF